MIHLGNITKIDGHTAPMADCIIGGSPCQDLSVAGRRAGLAGERSGLFMEQIRVVKEMREEDRKRGRTGNAIRPRFMVWENVPGAFSSKQGADFAAVLEETIGVVTKAKPVLQTPPGGWPKWGSIADPNGRWSVAWRVMDAQYWGRTVRERDSGTVVERGTAQRRRRITLVADFNGGAAADILFGKSDLVRDVGGAG